MVERIYKKDGVEEFSQAKKCSYCGGAFNKGVEIIVVGAVSGYKGTFCCNECRELGLNVGCEAEDKGDN